MHSKATTFVRLSVALAALALPLSAHAQSGSQPLQRVTGEYVEARSAAVYAGACHFNGEMTTAGREAVLAWKVAKGQSGGVTLDGLKIVAVVAGSDNLADAKTTRRSVLYVDSTATPEQRDALVGLLKVRAGASLGVVAGIQSTPVSFSTEGSKVTVAAAGAKLTAARYPCKHCLMPAETWYTPLSPTTEAAVAQGLATGFSDKTLGVTWNQGGTDNVYVGAFSL